MTVNENNINYEPLKVMKAILELAITNTKITTSFSKSTTIPCIVISQDVETPRKTSYDGTCVYQLQFGIGCCGNTIADTLILTESVKNQLINAEDTFATTNMYMQGKPKIGAPTPIEREDNSRFHTQNILVNYTVL